MCKCENYKDTKPQPRIQFLIKERKAYGTKTKCYGLFNSCNFIVNELKKLRVDAEAIQVIDNNCIDKHVTRFKPTHCFIEALWVVPEKFRTLSKLHPDVKWIIRIHSMTPFLAGEGMAFEWINEYIKLKNDGINIEISCNNVGMVEDINSICKNCATYSPNFYASDIQEIKNGISLDIDRTALNVGCFGALRILKNHLQQAVWAIEFAESLGKKLNLHINVSEHEQKEAGPILRNMRAIFDRTNHVLVEHPWYEHGDFIDLIKQMDIGMQVSFTETFNIVAADFVSAGVPIVVSNEIKFVNMFCRTEPTNKNHVMCALRFAYNFRNFGICKWNKRLLNSHNKHAIKQWVKILGR